MDIPAKLDSILRRKKEIEEIARNFADARGFFFIGRGWHTRPHWRARSSSRRSLTCMRRLIRQER